MVGWRSGRAPAWQAQGPESNPQYCQKKKKAYKQGKSNSSSPKSKKTCNVLNLSDQVKILYLLKGSMSLVQAGLHYGKMNQVSIVQVLNSMHFEHFQFFLNGSILRTI
jgi:hypothetical protein